LILFQQDKKDSKGTANDALRNLILKPHFRVCLKLHHLTASRKFYFIHRYIFRRSFRPAWLRSRAGHDCKIRLA